MNFWGRLIGTLLGFKIFGILGAFLGYYLGSLFDKGLKLHLHEIPRGRTASVQQAFFTATFSVMGHLAKADGRISEEEIRVAKNIMSRLELDESLRAEAMRLFSEGKEPEFDLESVLSNLYQECHQYPDLLRFFIEIQLESAIADGELQPEEKRILLVICDKLHVSPQEFEQLWARQWASQTFHQWFHEQFDPNRAETRYSHQYQRRAYAGSPYQKQASVKDAYGVLGIAPTATITEIKKAYRKLMSQHHPDKLASRGLPEGMVKLAKEKTQEIRAAYDLIREERGFK